MTGQTRDSVPESAGVRVHPVVVVAALVLVAVNLRTTVASVPPVYGGVRAGGAPAGAPLRSGGLHGSLPMIW